MADYEISWDGFDDLEDALFEAVFMDDVKQIVKEDTALMGREANWNAPVKTSNLKRSEQTTTEDAGMTGKTEFTVDYAPYQEYGTRWIYGKFYLKRAFDVASEKFINDLERIMK